LALVALSAFVHQLVVDRDDDDESAQMKCRLEMGRALHEKLDMKRLLKRNPRAYRRIRDNRHLASLKYRSRDWEQEQYVRAGNWLLSCVLIRFSDYFVLDHEGLPRATKEGEEYALNLCRNAPFLSTAYLPTIEPPADWTDWKCGGYWDDGSPIATTFIRSQHSATATAMKRIFWHGGCPHVTGVNTLQRVPWLINTKMLPVVRRHAGKIGKGIDDKVIADDLAVADNLGNSRFWIPLNCDSRGRVYGICHFNFQRQDYVRSLFLFANGVPITADGIWWLQVHVANCFDDSTDRGGISKRTWDERIAWVAANRDKIMRTAEDPNATVKWWRNADAPYSFVAGCFELAEAWKIGRDFITHLPITLDGSCNGIQHLAAMMKDEDAARLVNITASEPGDEPQDVYLEIANRVKQELQRRQSQGDVKAGWWLQRGITRKLIKRPAMTFGYSVTLTGMRRQLDEIYAQLHRDGCPDTFYLAQRIMEAAKQVLPGPTRAKKFIRELAKERADNDKVLEWTTPSGFPWANRYHESNIETLHMETRGEYFRCRVGEGYKLDVLKGKAMNAAAPNFVHGLDASHLINVVNEAASRGRTDIITIHDCFGCLAPQARMLSGIVRQQFAFLYRRTDVLADLRDASRSKIPLPDRGYFDPADILHSLYAFA
jgi:DNA-directed RNA polymerase, mitochondrial